MEDLLAKVPHAPYSVAAQCQGEITEKGQDGKSWRVLVCDGSSARRIKVSLSENVRIEAGEAPDMGGGDLELAVEIAARRFSERGRLLDPLPDEVMLRRDDFR